MTDQFLYVPNYKPEETWPGTRTKVQFFPGSLRRPTPSFFPQNRCLLQSGNASIAQPTVDENHSVFSGADGAAVHASATINYNFITLLITGVTLAVIFPMVVNGVADIIIVTYVIQGGDTNAVALGVGMDASLDNALVGSQPANGVVFSRNGASLSQISTAMELYFGNVAATAFTNAGGILTMTSNSFALADNNQQVRCAIYPSLPSPLPTTGQAGNLMFSGIGTGIHPGAVKNPKANFTPKTVITDVEDFLPDYVTDLIGLTGELTFELVQWTQMWEQAFASGSAAYGMGTNAEFQFPGGRPGLQRFGVVLSHTSKKVLGAIDVKIYYDCLAIGGLVRDLSKAFATGLPFKCGLIAGDSCDTVGVEYVYRQVAA